MSKEYIITCESTADLTAASAKEAGIPVLQQYFRIGEEHLEDTAEEQAERYQRCLAALRRGVSPVAVKTVRNRRLSAAANALTHKIALFVFVTASPESSRSISAQPCIASSGLNDASSPAPSRSHPS